MDSPKVNGKSLVTFPLAFSIHPLVTAELWDAVPWLSSSVADMQICA